MQEEEGNGRRIKRKEWRPRVMLTLAPPTRAGWSRAALHLLTPQPLSRLRCLAEHTNTANFIDRGARNDPNDQ